MVEGVLEVRRQLLLWLWKCEASYHISADREAGGVLCPAGIFLSLFLCSPVPIPLDSVTHIH